MLAFYQQNLPAICQMRHIKSPVSRDPDSKATFCSDSI